MVEPNIIKTKYYTLVSADTGHGKTLWCKKKVARLLRTTQDRIIVIDVTGEYADFVLDHDRIVPGRIPMVMHQYKLSGGWPVDTHIIEVDMPINRQPQLIVYDVRRTMGTWHRGVLAISDALLGYMTGRENTTTWLFLNLDPYFYEKQDDETSGYWLADPDNWIEPVLQMRRYSNGHDNTKVAKDPREAVLENEAVKRLCRDKIEKIPKYVRLKKLIELAANTAGTKLVVKYKTAEGEATSIASYRFRDLQDYQLIQQDGFYLRNGYLCLNPSSGMFITIDDALAFIPLDNVIGIKLPSGIVYP